MTRVHIRIIFLLKLNISIFAFATHVYSENVIDLRLLKVSCHFDILIYDCIQYKPLYLSKELLMLVFYFPLLFFLMTQFFVLMRIRTYSINDYY